MTLKKKNLQFLPHHLKDLGKTWDFLPFSLTLYLKMLLLVKYPPHPQSLSLRRFYVAVS